MEEPCNDPVWRSNQPQPRVRCIHIKLRPELLFALVCPVGTPGVDALVEELKSKLGKYGYESHRIKLSALLTDLASADKSAKPKQDELNRISRLMDEGDGLCRQMNDGSAVAMSGVAKISNLRESSASIESNEPSSVAYIFDSLKRPAEVAALRNIYGDQLIVISLKAPVKSREQELRSRVTSLSLSDNERDQNIDQLIGRDHRAESDEFGQNVLKTFPMADVFIDMLNGPSPAIKRLIDLLFANPDSGTPTDEEFYMNLAYIASTRSPELGRRVGAVLADGTGVIGIGTNRHPTEKKAPGRDESQLAIEKLVLRTLEQLKDQLEEQAKFKLDDDADGYVRELLDGPLRGSDIKNLIEFQQPVHAEMAALLDATRRGVRIDAATVYVTAYPCHGCSKHLLALEAEVKYLEPYPKSKTNAMYGPDAILKYLPFTGIAPRRYSSFFSASTDRKGSDGRKTHWGSEEKRLAWPVVNKFINHRGVAEREKAALASLGGAN